MHTVIVGAGGTGGFFGGLLARAGNDVTFVARGEHGKAMAENGLFVKAAQGEFHVPKVRVVDSVAKVEKPDLILIYLKTYSTQAILQDLTKVVTPETTVITFQTGLENDRTIADAIPTKRVYPGIIYINSKISAPGKIEQPSGLCTLTFGAREAIANSDLKEIESYLKSAGIKATLVDNIVFEMWRKLVWISAFAGMTVMFRSAIGKIVNDSDGEATFRRCLDESFAIANSQGVAFPPEVKNEILSKIEYHKGEGKNAKTSMLLDVEAGNRTEIETMHGELIRCARKAKLDTPLMEAVYSIVRVHESGLSK